LKYNFAFAAAVALAWELSLWPIRYLRAIPEDRSTDIVAHGPCGKKTYRIFVDVTATTNFLSMIDRLKLGSPTELMTVDDSFDRSPLKKLTGNKGVVRT
jgi:hypothetical protein